MRTDRALITPVPRTIPPSTFNPATLLNIIVDPRINDNAVYVVNDDGEDVFITNDAYLKCGKIGY